MSKVFSVARHEFIGTVTRLGYLLTLVGMPVFVGAVSGVAGLLAYQSQVAKEGRPQIIALVDDSGHFSRARLDLPSDVEDDIDRIAASAPKGANMPRKGMVPKRGPIELRRFASLAAAKDALLRGEVEAVVRFPPTYLKDGKVEELVRPPKGFSIGGSARKLRPWVVRSLVEERVPREVAERVARPLDIDTVIVEADGTTSPEELPAGSA